MKGNELKDRMATSEYQRIWLRHSPAGSHRPMLNRLFLGRVLRLFQLGGGLSAAVTLIGLGLMLTPSGPLEVQFTPDGSASVQKKLRLASAEVGLGSTAQLQLTEGEVNHLLRSSFEHRSQDQAFQEPATKQVSQLHDVRLRLLADRVVFYSAFSIYGKKLTFQVGGRLLRNEGRVQLDPEWGKLGQFPLPGAFLRRTLALLVDSPRSGAGLVLPQQISDIRVAAGQLLIGWIPLPVQAAL